MEKIPTIFLRNLAMNPRVVTRQINPECQWVFDGEGYPTVKWDGTSCLYRDGKLYKRHVAKPKKFLPLDFELVQEDPNTGKRMGWVNVGDRPQDQYHLDALKDPPIPLRNGTHELCGPKINRNPHGLMRHALIPHGHGNLPLGVPDEITWDNLDEYFGKAKIEGIVFYHPDGRMAKIKRRDFGYEWPVKFN